MSLFVAAQTALFDFAGKRVKIVKGETVVRSGHAILEGREHLFKKLHVHYDCPRPAPQPPAPAPAPVKTVQAKTASAKAVTPEPAEEE